MAKGVLPREWDGFNVNGFHCTADPAALFLSLSGDLSERSSSGSVPWRTAVTKFAWTFHCRCFAGVTCSKAAHVWRPYLLLFWRFRSTGGSGSAVCWCIKLCNEVLQSTAAVDSDLSQGFRGSRWTKPWVTDEEIGLFAPLWCTCTALKQARCVSSAISRCKGWWRQLKRSVFGERPVGRWDIWVCCVVEKEVKCGFKAFISPGLEPNSKSRRYVSAIVFKSHRGQKQANEFNLCLTWGLYIPAVYSISFRIHLMPPPH